MYVAALLFAAAGAALAKVGAAAAPSAKAPAEVRQVGTFPYPPAFGLQLAAWSNSEYDGWKMDAGSYLQFYVESTYRAVTGVAFNINLDANFWGTYDRMSLWLSSDPGCVTNPKAALDFASQLPAMGYSNGYLIPDDTVYENIGVADVCHGNLWPQSNNGTGPMCLFLRCDNPSDHCEPTGTVTFYATDPSTEPGFVNLPNFPSSVPLNSLPPNATCGQSITNNPCNLVINKDTQTACCPTTSVMYPAPGKQGNLRSASHQMAADSEEQAHASKAAALPVPLTKKGALKQ